MLVNLKEIIDMAEKGGYAIPAFNVYNTETVMGIIKAAEEERAPVIIQVYPRLLNEEVGYYLCPCAVAAARKATVISTNNKIPTLHGWVFYYLIEEMEGVEARGSEWVSGARSPKRRRGRMKRGERDVAVKKIKHQRMRRFFWEPQAYLSDPNPARAAARETTVISTNSIFRPHFSIPLYRCHRPRFLISSRVFLSWGSVAFAISMSIFTPGFNNPL